QTSGGGGGGRYTPSFSLEITPRNPAPQERIVAEIKSFSIDLDRATITWYLNDNRVFFGKGRKMFFFSAGDVGKRTTIEVVVEDNRFGIVTGSVSFVPVAVDLLWEAVDSYTPPFYKGRALPGLQSAVRIIALPYLSPSKENEADPGSFVYKWKKDGQFGPFNSQSGYGRNTLLFTPSVVDDSPEIGIEISSFDKTVSGENTLALVTADPFIHIYEEGPLQGIIYERAMEDGFAMKNKDAIFVAEPYFFSAETRSAKNLSYLWEQNGAAARGGKKGVFSVSSGKGSEQFSIALSVRNVAKILQEAEKSFTASWVGETVVNNALFGNI
ncbi:MAG: hypothetical protein AAB819_00415, partial [Patescibacteria group bacterium]